MSEQTKTEAPGQATTSPGGESINMTPARPEPEKTNTKFVLIVAAIVIVVVLLLVLAIIFLVSNPGTTAVIRDIFIIAMALTSVLIGLLMLVLIFQLQALIGLLRNEIKPMLTNANQTVSTVRGTASFVSDNLVRPTIGIASFMAGLKGVQQAVSGKVSTAGKRSSGSKATHRPSAK